jgi:hypothetical protein
VTTTVSPGTPTGSHDEKQTNGIAYNHAFTILGTKEVTDAAGTKTKLVKIRNPWGAEDYAGDWSDSSTKWTAALRTQAGSVVKNDGEFFITVADFKTSFEETHLNLNTDNMSRSHFLVLDDANTETRAGPTCSSTCSYHKFTIKSKTT